MRLTPLLIALALASLPASAETLADAASAAYLANPDLQAQRTQTSIAAEGVFQARSQKLPQVSAIGSMTGSSVSADDPAFDRGQSLSLDVGVRATQSLYLGGRIDSGIRRAQAGVDASKFQLMAFEQSLMLDVVNVYVSVLRDRRALEIRESNVRRLSEQLRAANDRFEVGEITRTDVAQAEARLAGAEAQFAAAKSTLESTEAIYAEVVGILPGALSPPPPLPVLPTSLEQAIEIATASNPSILFAMANEEAAREGIAIAEGALKPSVTIVGQAGVSSTLANRDYNDVSASIVGQVSVPLFEAGFTKSQVRQARLVREQTRRQRESQRLAVVSQVSRAWYVYEASRTAIAASERQVKAAEIAYEGAQQELEVGLRTTLDVLDQEQELLDARLALISVERDAYVAAFQLLASMGQLTPQVLDVKVPLFNPDEYLNDRNTDWRSTQIE
jgi:outer membrane protein